MALQLGIGKLSPELKNSFKTKNQLHGFTAEKAVTYLLNKNNWTLEFQRFKTVIAEIDLVFSKENKILLVEVKKLNNDWRSFQRIGRQQQQNLIKNRVFLSLKMPRFSFESYLCWVDDKNKISFVKMD